MFKNLRSLREKLMITVLLLLAVPMGIVVLIAQVRSQAVIRSQALTLSTKLVTAGAERLETSCERIDDIYRSIYLNEGFRAFLRGAGREKSTAERHRETEQLQSVFLSALSSRSDIFSVIYVTPDGRLVYAARSEAGSYDDYRAAALPDEYLALVSDGTLSSDSAVLLPTGVHMPLRHAPQGGAEPVYAVVRRIVNTEGHFEDAGTMFITVDLSDFEKLTELIRPGDDSRVCVCDETGRLVFDSSGAASGETLPEEMLCFADGAPQHELTTGGVSYAMASARAETAGWYVLMLTPQSEFSAGAMSVSSAILTAAVAALILIAVVTAIASRVISQPVKELADAMDETQLRDLSYRVTVSGADEIARLGNSFNALMDKLERSLAGEYEAALQQQKAEIRALQAQMNPHFLYNVLQSMASMAAVRHMSDLASMATALGSTMRYTISGSEPLVSLREELSYVENYLTIQKLRFGERLHAEIDVPEYVMSCAVPRVSIQPLVENAILHGLEQREKPGTIRIGAWTAGERLTVEVTDDGQGMTEEELAQLRSALYAPSPAEERRGIGLRNLYMRLRLLYDETAQLTLDSEEGIGTVVQIVIPMERRCGP